MGEAFFSAKTLDDIMRLVITEIEKRGELIYPSKAVEAGAREITGVLIEITNPRARLSLTESKGTAFSCLGELCWYLARTKRLDFVEYYLPRYKKYAEDGEIHGGYGPRLFTWKGNQVERITGMLRDRPDSRRAVIQLFDAEDLMADHKDVPCTCTLQFMKRGDRLHMFTCMRSNDAYFGLPHDVFCFTMLQELIARDLGSELGTYKHAVGSIHLYADQSGQAQQFLNEGWQSTENAMPPMPLGNPWSSIQTLLSLEEMSRKGEAVDEELLTASDPYWADLMRLLQIFRFSRRQKDMARVRELRDAIHCPDYLTFVDKVLDETPAAESGH